MERINVWKSILFTLPFIVVVEIFGLLHLQILLIPNSLDFETQSTLTFLIILFSEVCRFIFIYLILRKYVFKNKPISIPLRKTLSFVLIAILFGIIMIFIQPYIKTAFSYINGFPEYRNPQVQKFPIETWQYLSGIAIVILAPLTEELFFRGYLLQGLLRQHHKIIALLTSSVLFSLIHFDWITFDILSLRTVFITLIGGLFAGILYIKSGRFLVPLVFHMTWNLFAYLSQFVELPF